MMEPCFFCQQLCEVINNSHWSCQHNQIQVFHDYVWDYKNQQYIPILDLVSFKLSLNNSGSYYLDWDIRNKKFAIEALSNDLEGNIEVILQLDYLPTNISPENAISKLQQYLPFI